ncbi:MAG: hypothetical protein M5R40_06890 [Anaerolineae bacterium]|nr:hypothetical protein [Anaerolineae bacterium]
MLGATREANAPRAMFNEAENVQRLEPQGLDGEEIAREDLLAVVVEEGTPGTARRLRRGGKLIPDEDVADGGPVEREAKLAQFPSILS